MVEVIGVRFKPHGKIYYFSPQDFEIEQDTPVIVETSRGIEYGITAIAPREVPKEEIHGELKNVLRIATEEDKAQYIDNRNRAKEAMLICQEKVKEHNLEMRLISSEYTFDNSKLLFYFTAEGRVDFRALVRDLAAIFRTRIELRQIGVRDEAKLLGGLGCCGRETCCSSFLSEFAPVSIKMAKDQGLSLNPTNISGICGRLMCCLRYEQDGYEEILKRMPKNGNKVRTPLGEGIVLDTYTIQEMVKVKIQNGDSFEIHVFPREEISTGKREKKHNCQCGGDCHKGNQPKDVSVEEEIELGIEDFDMDLL
ncbi:stage 0 sporulation family protein [Peptoniphilus sp. KCTC 25270]|uniref:PSP1 domain-containing protein n=1 Tax=Peptoniphilus sp. KCTC 25270 TaxID=2897414 RepID=UPI001E3BB8D5|nr:stage 0 sporulation family protein [Peptoniphilus sp. KCTC 25270]MCD1147888.1 stage 0 sporulation family protein [Peptoniphilus sp. KCTC 25270]